MNYRDIIVNLEENKRKLVERLEKKDLTREEYESIQNSIQNYDYIIELTEMNHFERGNINHNHPS
ncbi:DUF3896 family protein, partial [Schinkia azotoformans]